MDEPGGWKKREVNWEIISSLARRKSITPYILILISFSSVFLIVYTCNLNGLNMISIYIYECIRI